MPLSKAQKTVECRTWAGSIDDLITLIVQIDKAIEPFRTAAVAQTEHERDQTVASYVAGVRQYAPETASASAAGLRESLQASVERETAAWQSSVEVLLTDGVLETYTGDPADLKTKVEESKVRRVKVEAPNSYRGDPRITLTLDKHGATLNLESSDPHWVRSVGEELSRMLRRQESFGSRARSGWGWTISALLSIPVGLMIAVVLASFLPSSSDGDSVSPVQLAFGLLAAFALPVFWAWGALNRLLWPGLELRAPNRRNLVRTTLGWTLTAVLSGIIGLFIAQLADFVG